ncbi:hypothetical protein ACF2G4_05720 [Pantoea sp. C3]|uniref:hypothetical protein n=1 Tax=Pantoea phytostimulans TaxID=2769024 RepID=UPI0038F5DB3E
MIIIHLRFDGGSTEEEHDIAHNGAHSYMIETRLPPCLSAKYFEKTGAHSHVIVRADAALAAR